MKKFAAIIGAAAAFCLSLGHAQAQSYPAKPVRFLVPFASGGSSDIIARSLANHYSSALGQQFVVENKAGGAGNIAMEETKRAAPDGYTLILGHVGTLAVNPAMFGAKLPYDAEKDFAPITLLALVPNVIAVHPDLPVKTLAELIAYAKANPGKLNYGTAGNGSAGHLAMEYFKLQSKLDIAHIPYRGTGPMLTDLLGGQVQLTFNGIPPILGHIKAGKLRPIAVGSAKRVSSLPDVPTIAESGFPGFETSQWYGLMAPAGTPKTVIDLLQAEAAKALSSGDAHRRITEDGALTAAGTPEAFAQLIAREKQRWGEVVRTAKIQPD